ncbi:hypothetical protein SAMN00777080_4514 [Aquiflexum balticum DSM 16537]|uniref:RND transporter n=1 Tax=Aquiflexum balticum DSM 16537 TaxID=758820 RepID=A0A1W2HAE1_9BACT|nr:hypothetical protein [Aquiflexum balticum]SMD45843.1 hypothetical protein SAMN00777080_4514 [Aquiflexum balticum DSM 16537]
MKETINNWRFVILLILTLGLAPFVPEPHIWGKIKWIAGGAKGMALMDWLDFVFHGIPWALLIRLTILKLSGKLPKPVENTPKM